MFKSKRKKNEELPVHRIRPILEQMAEAGPERPSEIQVEIAAALTVATEQVAIEIDDETALAKTLLAAVGRLQHNLDLLAAALVFDAAMSGISVEEIAMIHGVKSRDVRAMQMDHARRLINTPVEAPIQTIVPPAIVPPSLVA